MTENSQMAEGEEYTIDLMELFWAIVSRWKLLLCVVLLCAMAAGAINFFWVEPVYEASSKIYISSSSKVINIQELQLSNELTVDYEQILLSRTVLKKVISKLELPMTYKELAKMVTVSNPKDSHCLDITVTGPVPEDAVEIANCLVRTGVDQVYRIIGHEEPSIIDPAEMDAVVNVKPSLAKYALLGGLLGAVCVCGGVTVEFLMDNTLKTEEDVRRYMDLPVLAAIPSSERSEEAAEKGKRHAGRKNNL